ncbi:hypothetical protein [Nitrolancea hollandica]|uniref:Uncharacterized protein n=1 Tax=Nitrolancea hollandica Lb TaxID=1129897 RepID=I4ELM0_9BACT|nr:hypothetical protein [Nitrolancea hollandica]CCF85582.1 putative Predicted protein [Nitrolancea hollandica Lb]
MTRITRAEQETIIRRAADEECWDIYSEDPVMMRRLNTLAETQGITCRPVGDYGVRALIPKSWVKISVPPKRSEAQLAALARAREVRNRTAVGSAADA